MIKFFLILILSFIINSCNKLEFVYDGSINPENPLYNKSIYEFSGKDIPFLYKHVAGYLGTANEELYLISISTSEKKIKRAVQSNQAVSKLDYELDISYQVKDMSKKCIIFNKNIVSKFSYTPKSAGYNFGSDKSLDKMYEDATQNNLRDFVNLVSKNNISDCLNES